MTPIPTKVSNRLLTTRRWDAEATSVERTEEKRAAIKAKREVKVKPRELSTHDTLNKVRLFLFLSAPSSFNAMLVNGENHFYKNISTDESFF